MPKRFTSIVLFMALYLTGCMSIVQSVIGIKDARKLTDAQIIKASRKFKIDQNANYRLDPSYFSYIINLDTTKFKAQQKNHIQPLQALYFNAQGQLVKFYLNCYAGGFPNLKWNRNGNLDTFLPKDQAPTDTLLDLEKQLSFLKPVGVSPKEISIQNYDYLVFVYWNKCTKRHSRSLIKNINKNISKATNTKVKLIYVNYDNVFYELEHR